ncbi:MAG: hypothetical protein KAS32_31005 [Candidatus Peribacteraceae bacterium]|nr:hypothetical protein [Candidatus Peribacteraceae bacterium]
MTNNFGIIGRIERDEDALSPREFDNVGTMYCTHPGYNLGDGDVNLPEDTNDGSYMILGLYLYDHSGLRMSISPFSCSWDSRSVGVIYTKRGVEGLSDEDLRLRLEAEVAEYNSFLKGDAWGYVIEDAGGEVLDSCWGYTGNKEYCEKEMQTMLASRIKLEGERIEDRNSKYSKEDWINEVWKGNTILGLEDWRQVMEESDD